MKRDEFLQRISEQVGFGSPEDAEAAVKAVMEVLGETLRRGEITRIGAELPPWLATMLPGDIHDEPLSAASFFDRVATREDVGTGIAREHVGVILRTVAAQLSSAAQAWLRGALPAEMHPLLEPRSPSPSPARPHHADDRSTLSAGRPGSLHPVGSSEPNRSQHHSVVGSNNPHGDSKLSSSSGLTQEQLDESLAKGHPGSDRPLSDSED